MRSEQRIFRGGTWQHPARLESAQLVFAFGSGVSFDPALLQQVRTAYPRAHVVGCSTAGEIAQATGSDGTLVCSAVELERSSVEVSSAVLTPGAAELTGFQLAERLPKERLRHLFVVSNGIGVNGAALVRGMRELIPPCVAISGGLGGDAQLERTQVVLDGQLSAATVAAVGFYGERLEVGHGTGGGWTAFGPERRITKSQGNVLIELDGEPALALYRRYLGAHAHALRFPLAMPGGATCPVVGIDEAKGTLTFSGDMPPGGYVRLMRGSVSALVSGTRAAGKAAPKQGCLSLVVSCVGRRLSLHQRADEELEALSAGGGVMGGFYALGSLDRHTLSLTTLGES